MQWLALTYLMTLCGVVFGLSRPFYGLLVYIGFAILKPESLWHWAVPEASYSRLIGIALLIGWAARGFGDWRLERACTPVYCLIAFLLWAMLGAVQAPDQTLAWGFIEAMAKIILPFLVGVTTVDSVAKLKQLAWTLLLCQGYVALQMNLDYLGGFNRLQEMGFAGLDNNSVAIALVTAAGLGFFLVLGAENWKRKAVALLCVACLGHAVLFSFSRGGMLGLLIAGGVTFFLIPRQPRHYAFFALAVVAGLMLAGTQVRDRFMTTFAGEKQRDGSAESRLELWGNCLDTMGREPLFGEGPDHWPLVVHRYGWPKGKEAHTLWLQLGAELGVPALVFLLLFFGLLVKRLWPLARGKVEVPDPWLKPAASMTIASLVGFAVSAQFVSLKTLELPYYVALLGAGTLKLATLLAPEAGAWQEPSEDGLAGEAQALPSLQEDAFDWNPATVVAHS